MTNSNSNGTKTPINHKSCRSNALFRIQETTVPELQKSKYCGCEMYPSSKICFLFHIAELEAKTQNNFVEIKKQCNSIKDSMC